MFCIRQIITLSMTMGTGVVRDVNVFNPTDSLACLHLMCLSILISTKSGVLALSKNVLFGCWHDGLFRNQKLVIRQLQHDTNAWLFNRIQDSKFDIRLQNMTGLIPELMPKITVTFLPAILKGRHIDTQQFLSCLTLMSLQLSDTSFVALYHHLI